MEFVRVFANHKRCTGRFLLVAGIVAYVLAVSVAVSAQTIDTDLRPDLERALANQPSAFSGKGRINGYVPAEAGVAKGIRPRSSATTRNDGLSSRSASHPSAVLNPLATSA